jgi:hypothetical protein
MKKIMLALEMIAFVRFEMLLIAPWHEVQIA